MHITRKAVSCLLGCLTWHKAERGKWLLGDEQRTSGAHDPILIIYTLMVFQRVATNVGNGCAGVHGFIPNFGNNGVGV